MNKLFYTFLICLVLLSLNACEDQACHKTCQNGGTIAADECKCECPVGWEGEFCEKSNNQHRLHADVIIDGKPKYSYDPLWIDLDLFDHATDTLWVDGYDDSLGTYCFLQLYINDHTTITDGSTFPVNNTRNPGTCWASFLDPSVNANPYHALPANGGTITIRRYNPGVFIWGEFDIHLELSPSSAHLKGWFEDD